MNIDWHTILDRAHLVVGILLYLALQLLGLMAIMGFGFLVIVAASSWLS